MDAPPAETPPPDDTGISWTPPLSFADGAAAYKRGDYQLALAAWQPLANKGDVKAENGLGVLYEYGYAVPQDYRQSSLWLRKAVAHGSLEAADNLGWMYERGFGVKADTVCAYMWYSLAVARGPNNERAKSNLDRVGGWMLPGRVSTARDLAAACEKSNFEDCS